MEIESKLEQAKAAGAIARQQLSHTTIAAPFDGVIASKQADMGTYVLPGQPVLKIANVTAVNARISVPEAEISHLHIGDKVKLSVAAIDGAVFYGTISEKGIDANPISHIRHKGRHCKHRQASSARHGMQCANSKRDPILPELSSLPKA